MLTEGRKHIKLIFTCLKYNVIKALDNRLSFIMQVLGMVLNNGVMIIQWIVLFSIKDNIGGYGFKEMLILWAFSSSTYGIAHLIFANAFELSNLIISGKLDAFLVQPKNTLIYASASKSSISAIGDILYGYILLIILRVNLTSYLLFTLLSISGGLVLTACTAIWNSLTFFFKNMEDVAHVIDGGMISFATYPDKIFTKEVRWLFVTFLPVSFITHIPVNILTDFDIRLLLIVLGFTCIIVLLSFIIFKQGLKRYSSSNLMGARI